MTPRCALLLALALLPLDAVAQVRLLALEWMGNAEDQVGTWSNGLPDGSPDGRFRISIDFGSGAELRGVSLYSADATGKANGSHRWDSRDAGYFVLAVGSAQQRLHESHVATLGGWRGSVGFDLFAQDVGWFVAGNTVRAEIALADGRSLVGALTLGTPVIPPWASTTAQPMPQAATPQPTWPADSTHAALIFKPPPPANALPALAGAAPSVVWSGREWNGTDWVLQLSTRGAAADTWSYVHHRVGTPATQDRILEMSVSGRRLRAVLRGASPSSPVEQIFEGKFLPDSRTAHGVTWDVRPGDQASPVDRRRPWWATIEQGAELSSTTGLDLNAVGVTGLERAGLSPPSARSVVEGRLVWGPYAAVDEALRAPGLSDAERTILRSRTQVASGSPR